MSIDVLVWRDTRVGSCKEDPIMSGIQKVSDGNVNSGSVEGSCLSGVCCRVWAVKLGPVWMGWFNWWALKKHIVFLDIKAHLPMHVIIQYSPVSGCPTAHPVRVSPQHLSSINCFQLKTSSDHKLSQLFGNNKWWLKINACQYKRHNLARTKTITLPDYSVLWQCWNWRVPPCFCWTASPDKVVGN